MGMENLKSSLYLSQQQKPFAALLTSPEFAISRLGQARLIIAPAMNTALLCMYR